MASPQKIMILDSLRGIVALFVALHHFLHFENHHGRLISADNAVLEAISPFMIGSVSVFFIISGYVIYLHLDRHEYQLKLFGKFMLKRIVRLHIPMIICILIIVVINNAFNYYLHLPLEFSSERLLANIFLYASLLPELDWYNPIFWTLAIEFQFYILIALLYPIIRKTLFWPLLIGGIAFFLINFFFQLDYVMTYYGAYFIIGIALYLYHSNQFSWLLTSIIILVGSADVIVNHDFLYPVIPLLSIPVILWVKTRFRFLEWMGELSYSFYLMHGLFGGWFIYFTGRFASNGWMQILVVLGALILSFGGSYLFYLAVEKGSLKMSRKISYSKR